MKQYILTLACLIGTAASAFGQSAAQRLDRGSRMGRGAVSVTDVSVNRGEGRVTVDMSLNLDSLRMPVNERMVYTPQLRTAAGTVDMPQIVINGRRQQVMYRRGETSGVAARGDGATVVGRRNGKPQTVSYSAAVPITDGTTAYDVWIREDLCGCGDSLAMNDYLLSRRSKPLLVYMRPEASPKLVHLDKTAYIDYPVDRTELHPDYRRNPAELDSIVRTINQVKADPNYTIRKIDIHGFASPESPYEHNDYLARERAKTLKDYVSRLVDIDAGVFTVSHTAEDWDGLVSYIRSDRSKLAHGSEILDIIADARLDPDAREWKIKTAYPDDYRYMLRTWYPALRRSDYHVWYTIRPFTVDEARELVKTRPQLLSVEEMYLVAQTCEPGSPEFNEIMEVAVRMFPDDPTANLNAACTRLDTGDADGAKPYLDKAGSSAHALNARAAYWQLKGDDARAAELYRQAAQAGLGEAATNLDNVE